MSSPEEYAKLNEALEKLLTQSQHSVKPIVSASMQPFLAILLTIVALVAMGAFAVVGNKSIVKSITYAGVSSLAGGFAIVFICNSLGVYV